MPVDARWCLVHATHVTPPEWQAIVASRAVVGLCPITEANLGDGLFPAADFHAAGGRFGVGTDSNVEIDASGELRLLEYGQRLIRRERNVLARPGGATGRALFDAALADGAAALGQPAAGLCVGAPADIVTLDRDHTALGERHGDALLDGWIFSGGKSAVDCVWRRGVLVVRQGRHRDRSRVVERYRGALRRLLHDD
jgi:formimidoylglutamate deiminase